ncbi:hypothetical protein [Alkalihalobacillus pseudalcaliphilus]|uniref:hypothetical protein n=1 Tax=Alkalihalobacillus pseudalcaliphilus TaxID=79884 RepID=UPI000A7DAB78|nr:hypothetical protein [Alkalihalobacillus pseudalcaliphilus]
MNTCRCSVNLPDFVTFGGLISEEGTITSRSGFTVQHTSLGVYTVRVEEPYTLLP